MSNSIRVLLCDDSSVMRRLLKAALRVDADIEVVCEAKHGQDALDKLFDARPDVVVMDVEMPVMDGIDAVREIRKRTANLPIIMFSSLTSRGAEATLDAIDAGASDFATKPASAGHITRAMAHVQTTLIPKIHYWCDRPLYRPEQKANPVTRPASPTPRPVARQPVVTNTSASPIPVQRVDHGTPVSAIAIGVSTGGPQALAQLVADLPHEFPAPILIAQHMPPVFTGLLADRLAAQTSHVVREAKDGDELKPNEILIAPGDHHMVISRDRSVVRARLNQDEPENSCRPAVDPLFRSFAECYGSKCLGVVLTGMGKDGEKGAEALRQRGARIVVQDEQTSVVWGMPGNVAKRGLADRILPLDQIAMEIVRATQSPRTAMA